MGFRVLIIGAYGNFGAFIAHELVQHANITLILAGRQIEKAKKLRNKLNGKALIEVAVLDINNDINAEFSKIRPDFVVHTSGPFQNQNYHIAKACIQYGCHYVDLADAREFVCAIDTLDKKAKEKGLAIISGASSVPGLTSAIIEKYSTEFQKLEEVEYAIATAQLTNRGLATVRAVLSYAGKPFTTMRNGEWVDVYGWDSIEFRKFWKLKTRALSHCDIPDLTLFPERYPNLHTVEFKAGLELTILQILLAAWSKLVRFGALKSLQPLSNVFLRTSHLFDWLGSDNSGFYMEMRGIDANGLQQKILFEIVAKDGAGLCIPAIPSIILATKAANKELDIKGAFPCVGLVPLDEYLVHMEKLGIEYRVVRDVH